MNLQVSSLLSDPSRVASALRMLEAEQTRRKSERRLATYQPYPKQAEFHAAGASHSERLFMAGNQLGKTWAGGFETAMHLTGLYPEWWQGRRYDEPVRMWCGGKDRLQHRDAAQTTLLGPAESEHLWGTGTIPKARISDVIRALGVRNAVDTIVVDHVAGGRSTLGFKTYDMDRQSWQGPTLHAVWFDEEPPLDVYVEGLTRTNKYGQFAYITFTPLLGMSDVVALYLLRNQ